MRIKHARWIPIGLLLGTALVSGCAGSQLGARPVRDPHVVMKSYASALRQGHLKDAYGLLSQRAQREMSFAQFQQLVRESPSQVQELAAELSRSGASESVVSTVTTPKGRTLRLLYQDGAWRVDGSSLTLYSQQTPARALDAFVHAFSAKRYDILLRFVPQNKRQGLDAVKLKKAWEGPDRQDIIRWVDQVRISLPDAKVDVVGDRASVMLGADRRVDLVREDGDWRIQRFE